MERKVGEYTQYMGFSSRTQNRVLFRRKPTNKYGNNKWKVEIFRPEIKNLTYTSILAQTPIDSYARCENTPKPNTPKWRDFLEVSGMHPSAPLLPRTP